MDAKRVQQRRERRLQVDGKRVVVDGLKHVTQRKGRRWMREANNIDESGHRHQARDKTSLARWASGKPAHVAEGLVWAIVLNYLSADRQTYTHGGGGRAS